MARRFFMGPDISGVFRIRQAKPGFDAKSAAPHNCLFDADYVPVRPLGSGTNTIKGAAGTAALQTNTFGHGIGRAPDLVLAVAVQRRDDNGQQLPWVGTAAFGTTVGTYTASNQGNMASEFCGPFYMSSTVSGPEATGSGRIGWWVSFDASNINVHHFTPPTGAASSGDPPPIHLFVKWSAFAIQ